MPMNEINELRDRFITQLSPLRVYLFGVIKPFVVDFIN